jgi:ABC-type transport system involved in multi-copper enzyme maturation permease subunit
MTAPDSLRGIWPIAVYTWREGIRKKTLIGFLILSLLVIFGSMFMTAFMAGIDYSPSGEINIDVESKLVKDVCVSAIAIFGILIAIFTSASVVPQELENRVIYTVLSKPVKRYQYLLGKFLGVQMIVIANLVLMSALFFIALWIKEQIIPTLLLWSTLLTYFQFLIVSSFTFAISCAATSSVLPTIAGLFIYITGNLTNYLNDVFKRSSGSDNPFEAAVAEVARLLYAILPNLRNFDLKDQILYLAPNDPPAGILIPNLILYGVLYALSGYLLAFWLFRRKEL